MFGQLNPPFEIELKNTKLSCELTEDGFIYRRWAPEQKKELLILSKKANFLLSPIEPVNLPKKITHFLYIELQKSVVLGPSEKAKFYIKFPVEISLFVSKGKDHWDSIDTFCLGTQKFTLYGEITSGHICRYFPSAVYRELPQTDSLVEGIMAVEVRNKTHEWAEINALVFDAYHMKIYYDNEIVCMNALVEINSEMVAETTFRDKPLRKGMQKAIELYIAKKIPVFTDKFVMEWGY